MKWGVLVVYWISVFVWEAILTHTGVHAFSLKLMYRTTWTSTTWIPEIYFICKIIQMQGVNFKFFLCQPEAG